VSDTKIISLVDNCDARFPYPVGKKKLNDVLSFIRIYQENLIINRINHYINDAFFNNKYISNVIIKDIEFDYNAVRNNSHLESMPLKDKIFQKYQSIDVEVKIELELCFHRSLNYVKVKDSKFYEDLCSNEYMRGMLHSTIFRSIIDANIDDLF